MMISTNYDVRELVPLEIWQRFGEKSIRFCRPNMVEFLEWFSSYMKIHVVVNNYHFHGQVLNPKKDEPWYFNGHIYQNSGFRTPSCPEGASLSQHRFMNGIDCKAKGFDAETMRGVIRENFPALNKRFGVTTIEADTPTWCHVDFRWTGMTELLEVPYK